MELKREARSAGRTSPVRIYASFFETVLLGFELETKR